MNFRDNSKVKENLLEKLKGREFYQLYRDATISTLYNHNVIVFPKIVDNISLSDDSTFFRPWRGDIYTSNLMGTIRYQEEVYTIGSRFDVPGKEHFFQYMLEKVFEINFTSLSGSFSITKDLIKLLPYMFVKLLEECLTLGVYKEYTRNKYNDLRFSGSLDAQRHIIKNIPFNGNIAYSKREFNYDNSVTQLIRHTIEYIKDDPNTQSILYSSDLIRRSTQTITSATPSFKKRNLQSVVTKNKSFPVNHAYYHKYREIQELCILILSNKSLEINHNEKSKCNGFIIDGAWLFEEYINTILKPLFHHPENKTKKGKQHYFEGSIGEIYPDFISKDSKNRVIADAKYKYIKGIAGADYTQLLGYMMRFESTEGYFIYPHFDQSRKITKDTFNLLSGVKTQLEKTALQIPEVKVYKLGFEIPFNQDSYELFKVMMKKNENSLFSEFKK